MSFEECVSHATADDENIDLIQQITDDTDFVTDLGAAQDCNERVLGMMQDFAEILEFFFHEKTGSGLLNKFRDANRGSVGAMRSAECVIYVIVSEFGKLFRELLIVGFLFSVKAQIFQQEGLAFFQLAGYFF